MNAGKGEVWQTPETPVYVGAERLGWNSGRSRAVVPTPFYSSGTWQLTRTKDAYRTRLVFAFLKPPVSQGK